MTSPSAIELQNSCFYPIYPMTTSMPQDTTFQYPQFYCILKGFCPNPIIWVLVLSLFYLAGHAEPYTPLNIFITHDFDVIFNSGADFNCVSRINLIVN